jgi:hypothetical protein
MYGMPDYSISIDDYSLNAFTNAERGVLSKTADNWQDWDQTRTETITYTIRIHKMAFAADDRW